MKIHIRFIQDLWKIDDLAILHPEMYICIQLQPFTITAYGVFTMTKRERYLNALHNNVTDELVWAPNFDYWLMVNQAENSLPDKYRDMSRNEIVRSIGGYIWNRASGYRVVMDTSVKQKSWMEGTDSITELSTPAGTLRSVYSVSEGESRSRFLKEHYVKDLDSLKTMQYVVEATHYEPDYEPVYRALEETGDDGIVLHQCFCVPFIQFAKTDAGYINGYYLWADYRNEVDSLINAYFESFLQGFKVLADGPADVISTGDNMDGTTISPSIFQEYAVPFYREVKKILSARGKIFQGHWCGRTQNLLSLTPGCGLDVIEAIVTTPMADITVKEALARLDGKIVMQGGIPAVMVCEEGCKRDNFIEYIQKTIKPLKGTKGFILGMSDNVPPNADFGRVEMIAELI